MGNLNIRKDNLFKYDKIFKEFVLFNKQAWDEFSPPENHLEDKLILVDCMVDFPPYIHGNMIVAKFLQKATNAKIAVVVRDQEQLSRNQSILKSFSVKEAFFSMAPVPLSIETNIDRFTKETNPKKVREGIINFALEGLVIGDLIYDAYLRDTGLPTIDRIDNTLLHYFSHAEKIHAIYKKIFENRNVIATVQAHTVYIIYGILARVALANGAVVFGRKPGTSPFTIRMYNKLSELGTWEIGFRKKDYEYIYRHHKERAIEFSKDFLRKRFKGKSIPSLYAHTQEAYSQSKQHYSRNDLIKKIDMHPDKPIVFIMCHAFSDAPHVDSRMLHNDYFEWLEETLEIVSGLMHVNWVVKPHPEDKYYESKEDHAAKIATEYTEKHSNIFLSPEDLNTSSILEYAHAVVTVRSTAALEFSAMGIPSIVTGRFTFTSLGFTIEPETKEAYIETLTNIHDCKRLSSQQTDRALTCCYLYYNLALVETRFIPSIASNWHTEFDAVEYLEFSLAALKNHRIEDDPIYKNFKIQLRHGLPYLMKFDEIPRFEEHLIEDMKTDNERNSPCTAVPDSKSALFHLQNGEDLFNSGFIEEALRAFKKAVYIDPAYAEAYNNIGVVSWEKGDADEAIANFGKALKINPGQQNALQNLKDVSISTNSDRKS
jgi:tetratricopeptide repeat protein/capsular polysaccharide biosynthesis protein